MIDTYKRLHREEQKALRALGEEPSHMTPMQGLAIGVGMTLAGLLGIVIVLGLIGLVLS